MNRELSKDIDKIIKTPTKTSQNLLLPNIYNPYQNNIAHISLNMLHNINSNNTIENFISTDEETDSIPDNLYTNNQNVNNLNTLNLNVVDEDLNNAIGEAIELSNLKSNALDKQYDIV
jgi:hypothetical protein